MRIRRVECRPCTHLQNNLVVDGLSRSIHQRRFDSLAQSTANLFFIGILIVLATITFSPPASFPHLTHVHAWPDCTKNVLPSWNGWVNVQCNSSLILPFTRHPALSVSLGGSTSMSSATTEGSAEQEKLDATTSRMLTVFGASTSSGLPTASIFGSRDKGNSWMKLNPDGSPWSPRSGHTVIQTGKEIFLIGGVDRSQTYLNDVWRYSISKRNSAASYAPDSWELKTGAGAFLARAGHCAASFEGGALLLIWAGLIDRSDLWKSVDSGATWSEQQMTVPYGYRATIYPSCTTTKDGVIYMIGGHAGNEQDPLDSLMSSSDFGTTWHAFQPSIPTTAISPPVRYGAAMAFGKWHWPATPADVSVSGPFGLTVPTRTWLSGDAIVLSGGIGTNGLALGDTWILDLRKDIPILDGVDIGTLQPNPGYLFWTQTQDLEGAVNTLSSSSRARAWHSLVYDPSTPAGFLSVGGQSWLITGNSSTSPRVQRLYASGEVFYFQPTCYVGARPSCYGVKEEKVAEQTEDGPVDTKVSSALSTGAIVGIVVGVIGAGALISFAIYMIAAGHCKPKPKPEIWQEGGQAEFKFHGVLAMADRSYGTPKQQHGGAAIITYPIQDDQTLVPSSPGGGMNGNGNAIGNGILAAALPRNANGTLRTPRATSRTLGASAAAATDSEPAILPPPALDHAHSKAHDFDPNDLESGGHRAGLPGNRPFPAGFISQPFSTKNMVPRGVLTGSVPLSTSRGGTSKRLTMPAELLAMGSATARRTSEDHLGSGTNRDPRMLHPPPTTIPVPPSLKSDPTGAGTDSSAATASSSSSSLLPALPSFAHPENVKSPAGRFKATELENVQDSPTEMDLTDALKLEPPAVRAQYQTEQELLKRQGQNVLGNMPVGAAGKAPGSLPPLGLPSANKPHIPPLALGALSNLAERLVSAPFVPNAVVTAPPEAVRSPSIVIPAEAAAPALLVRTDGSSSSLIDPVLQTQPSPSAGSSSAAFSAQPSPLSSISGGDSSQMGMFELAPSAPMSVGAPKSKKDSAARKKQKMARMLAKKQRALQHGGDATAASTDPPTTIIESSDLPIPSEAEFPAYNAHDGVPFEMRTLSFAEEQAEAERRMQVQTARTHREKEKETSKQN